MCWEALKLSLKKPRKRCLKNDDSGRSSVAVDGQRCRCPGTLTPVHAWLKLRYCSVAASLVFRYSVNDHKKKENIYFDKKDKIA